MSKPYALDQPAEYTISVYGHLNQKWATCMGGMQIRHPTHLVGQSVLTGILIDQAQLFGVLNSLYMLGMVLLHVALVDTSTNT